MSTSGVRLLDGRKVRGCAGAQPSPQRKLSNAFRSGACSVQKPRRRMANMIGSDSPWLASNSIQLSLLESAVTGKLFIIRWTHVGDSKRMESPPPLTASRRCSDSIDSQWKAESPPRGHYCRPTIRWVPGNTYPPAPHAQARCHHVLTKKKQNKLEAWFSFVVANRLRQFVGKVNIKIFFF